MFRTQVQNTEPSHTLLRITGNQFSFLSKSLLLITAYKWLVPIADAIVAAAHALVLPAVKVAAVYGCRVAANLTHYACQETRLELP